MRIRKKTEPIKMVEYLQQVREEYDPDDVAATLPSITGSKSLQPKAITLSRLTLSDRMYTLLAELKDIEAIGPYYLIKTKEGKWRFRAPSIELEE